MSFRPQFSLLDFKLGVRMLVRYPGLTLVGGLAMAFAIWVCASTFELMRQVVRPTLPLPDGDRIIALRMWDMEANRVERRALYDFLQWREQLTTVRDIGAARTLTRNLITPDGRGEPIEVAEITASAFELTRAQPLLGRVLLADDERLGAPPVIVIGHEVWQRRFAGDSAIVGRSVRLGETHVTIVGVMGREFGFPVSQRLWMPLRFPESQYEPRTGFPIQIFGRLAPGVALEEAQAELNTLAQRAAQASPETHRWLQAQVLPYAESIFSLPLEASLALMSSNLGLVFLLGLICANVALLMFARAAARESELVVRTALGASRQRIIGQLVAEALVLSGLATVFGLAAAGVGMRWALGMVEANLNGVRLPFWIGAGLAPSTVAYSALLAVVAALIAGVLPALKVTRGMGTRLREASAGGGGLQFGGFWTVVIVTQVALTMIFPAVAFFLRRDTSKLLTYDLGVSTREYLAARLEMDRDAPPGTVEDTSRAAFQERYELALVELERRLAGEPAVTGVTFATALPLMYHAWHQIDVDEGAVEPRDARGHRMGVARIAEDYFDVLNVPILAGRAFRAGDFSPDARAAIVNQPFVDSVLAGKNPIGRRIRHVANEDARVPTTDGPWYEIVGVVQDLGTTSGYGRSGIYHPIVPGQAYPVHVAIHVRGDPLAFASRLRSIATVVSPRLRVHDMIPMNETIGDDLAFYHFWFRLTVYVSGIAVLLSLAGIYAVMSFTVARRTREIGIRIALGAEPQRVLRAVFRRPLMQVGLGVLAGGLMIGLLMTALEGGNVSLPKLALLAAYAGLTMAVCALACVVPTRRALAIEPTEALRSEG